MVGGTSGGIRAHSISCSANSSQRAGMDCVVGVVVGCAGSTNAGDDGTAVTTAEAWRYVSETRWE